MDLKKVKRMIGVGVLIVVVAFFTAFTFQYRSVYQNLQVDFVSSPEDADCILLHNSDTSVLIDTGLEETYETLDATLKKYDVDFIDCVVLTHPDKDHIGGMLSLLKDYEVRCVVFPYYPAYNERFEEIQNWIQEHHIQHVVLSRYRVFTYGDIQVSIYPPNEFDYNDTNNYSLATVVRHGDVSMFFAGDAKNKRISELLEYPLPDVDLMKLNYHGRYSDLDHALLEKLDPEFIVCTSDHVSDEYASILKEEDVYFTVNQEVVFISDGKFVQLVTPKDTERVYE